MKTKAVDPKFLTLVFMDFKQLLLNDFDVGILHLFGGFRVKRSEVIPVELQGNPVCLFDGDVKQLVILIRVFLEMFYGKTGSVLILIPDCFDLRILPAEFLIRILGIPGKGRVCWEPILPLVIIGDFELLWQPAVGILGIIQAIVISPGIGIVDILNRLVRVLAHKPGKLTGNILFP